MNKMEYRRPEADLVIFDNEDIITTSGDPNCPFNPGYDVCLVFTGYATQPCSTYLGKGYSGGGRRSRDIPGGVNTLQDWDGVEW